jgi:TPR repeat protein
MYFQGKGVAQDYSEALKLMRKAADQGDAEAQEGLGEMYREGKGIPQDYAEAVKWFRLAADQGMSEAQYNLGLMYGNGRGVPTDYVRAHMWLNLSAAQGFEQAATSRDRVALRMTPAQIAEAQGLAREWKPTKQQPR